MSEEWRKRLENLFAGILMAIATVLGGGTDAHAQPQRPIMEYSQSYPDLGGSNQLPTETPENMEVVEKSADAAREFQEFLESLTEEERRKLNERIAEEGAKAIEEEMKRKAKIIQVPEGGTIRSIYDVGKDEDPKK